MKGKQVALDQHFSLSDGLGPKTSSTQHRQTVFTKRDQTTGWRVTVSRKIMWGDGGSQSKLGGSLKNRAGSNWQPKESQLNLPKLNDGRASQKSRADFPIQVSRAETVTSVQRVHSSVYPSDHSLPFYDGERMASSRMSKHESDTYHSKLISKLRPPSKSYPGVTDILAERSESWKTHNKSSTYTSGLPFNTSSRSLKPQKEFDFAVTRPYFSYFRDH